MTDHEAIRLLVARRTLEVASRDLFRKSYAAQEKLNAITEALEAELGPEKITELERKITEEGLTT